MEPAAAVEPSAAPVARAGFVGRFLSSSIIPRAAVGRRFAVIAMIDSLGTGMYYVGSALFFTRIVGLSVGQVGIGLSAAGIVGFFGVVPIGILADRVGVGRIYISYGARPASPPTAWCDPSPSSLWWPVPSA